MVSPEARDLLIQVGERERIEGSYFGKIPLKDWEAAPPMQRK